MLNIHADAPIGFPVSASVAASSICQLSFSITTIGDYDLRLYFGGHSLPLSQGKHTLSVVEAAWQASAMESLVSSGKANRF